MAAHIKIIKTLKQFAVVALISIILTIIISFFAQIGQVNGKSMENTLKDKEYVLINKVVYKTHIPEHGDIIALHINNGEILVKRVIAIPGDTIEIKNDKAYLNDKELDEEYIKEPMKNNEDMKIVVPEGEIFVMGDNRNYSLDSRSLLVGMIAYKNDVIGKVIVL